MKEGYKILKRKEYEFNVFNKDREKWNACNFFADVEIDVLGRGKTTNVFWEFPTRLLNVIKDPDMYVILDLMMLRELDRKQSYALY